MKKRVIAVLTAVLMTASLVGCGSGKLSNDYVTVNRTLVQSSLHGSYTVTTC